MTTLTQASRQWATRPADERFESLHALAMYTGYQRQRSRGVVVSSRALAVKPAPHDELKSLEIHGPNGVGYAPTHWSFGQLSRLVNAPPRYLRTLPAPLAADCLNYNIQFRRDIEDVGCLLRKNGEDEPIFAAATGPNYGRIWNADIGAMLVDKFGDGVTGPWRVPGEFGKRVEVTKANTTIYASDRDMFVFLADEDRRIEIPNRRNGQPGSLARGFFVWNSEVGAASLGAAFFLFDYVCCNRIIWGATQYNEKRIRHTAGAPDKWLEEIVPVLDEYSRSSAKPVLETIEAARQRKLGDKLDVFLAGRFGKGLVSTLKAVHEREEDRPIETLWDASVAVTAHAKSLTHQNERVALERKAGELLSIPFAPPAREMILA